MSQFFARYLSRTAVLLISGCVLFTNVSCNQLIKQKTHYNFLFYIADDLSPFTDSQNVPAFRRVGEEGVVFTNAFTNAPSCTPARGIVLTGQPLWNLKEGGTLFGALPVELPVFPLMLEQAGYFVGHTGKAWGPGSLEAGGWPESINPVGIPYKDILSDPAPPGMTNENYAANFQAFLEDRPANQPFFFWYGSFEPHRKFEAGQGIKNGKKLSDAYVPPSLPDHEIIRNDIIDYDIEVEFADAHFGRMIDQLEARGELENTIIIVTSDHGMAFPRAKATGLYDDATHIPLFISGPDIAGSGRRVSDFVGLMDLAPTILDFAGIRPNAAMHGKSLKPQLTTSKSGRIDKQRDHIVMAIERHTIARPNYLGYPMRALRTDSYLLVHNYEPDRWPAGDPDYISIHQGIFGDIDAGPAKDFIIEIASDPEFAIYHELATGQRPAFELFDLSKDRAQLNNVADDPEYAVVADSLTSILDDYLQKAKDPRAFGHSPWDQNRYYFGDLPEIMPAGDPGRWDIK
ncbi:MAG: sulfatase [Rhodothermales bacterium]